MKKLFIIIILPLIFISNNLRCQSCFIVDSNYLAIGNAYSIINSDFNKDGLLDLVISNIYADSIPIFLGYGNAKFGAKKLIIQK